MYWLMTMSITSPIRPTTARITQKTTLAPPAGAGASCGRT
jgi:hypothetical protein